MVGIGRMSISNIVFIGADDFGRASLEKLAGEGYNINGVITEVDDPCVEFSESHDIPALRLAEGKTRVRSSTLVDFIGRRNPDLLVMCVWEKKIPKQIVDSYGGSFINFHGSPLPLYRGWAPINWQIIHGKSKIGMTVSLVAEKFDRGDILVQEYFPIDDRVNAGDVYDIMQPKAADMILRVVDQYSRGHLIKARKQPQRKVFPEAPKPNQENTMIHWDSQAKQVHNLIRGWNPMAYAYTTAGDIKLYLSKSQLVNPRKKEVPGEIVWYGAKKFEVSCGGYNLMVHEVLNNLEEPYDMPRLMKILKKHHPVVLGR